MPASREGAGMVRGFEPPGFLRTRECRRVEATCASWPNVAHDLGGSGIAGDRCCPLDLVIRGPDVAPRSRAWKARTGRRADRGHRPPVQLVAGPRGPLLTVDDPFEPLLRARQGHGRRA